MSENENVPPGLLEGIKQSAAGEVFDLGSFSEGDADWEYGVRAKGDDGPFTDHYDSFEDMRDEFDGRVVWGDDEEVVRRRKAGPWEPVSEEGA